MSLTFGNGTSSTLSLQLTTGSVLQENTLCLEALTGSKLPPLLHSRMVLRFPPSCSWDSPSSNSSLQYCCFPLPLAPHLCPPTFAVLFAFPLVWPNTFTFVFRKLLGSTSSFGEVSSRSETTWPSPALMDLTAAFLRGSLALPLASPGGCLCG